MDGFETFWAKWPKRVARKDALKAWAQVHGDAHLDAILAALDWQTQQPQWTKDDGAYVPYPATWLRGERWTDERPLSAAEKAQQAEEQRQRAEFAKWKAQGHPVFAPYATFEEFQARRRSA